MSKLTLNQLQEFKSNLDISMIELENIEKELEIKRLKYRKTRSQYIVAKAEFDLTDDYVIVSKDDKIIEGDEFYFEGQHQWKDCLVLVRSHYGDGVLVRRKIK